MSDRRPTPGTDFRGDADDSDVLQRYRALLNGVGDGIYQVDADDRFVAVNDAVVETTGYAREELLGEPVSVLLGDDGSTPGRALAEPTDGGDRREVTVRTAGGERVRCEVRVTPLEAGDPSRGTVGIVRDATGRSAAGGESADPDRRLEHERVIEALELAREGISLLDDDGAFVYVNDAYADTFGYDPGEMIGERWDALGIEADPDRFHDDILPRLAEEGQWTGTTTCVRSDDSTFLAQHSLTHTEDDQLICVVRDVTEHERTRRQLAEERDMFAQGPAIVFRWAPDEAEGWPVEYVSENVEDVLGYTPEELESGAVPYTDLLLDEELDRIAAEVEANSDGTTERFSHDPYRVETRDGDVRWVQDTTKIVRDDAGEIDHYLGYLVDITERKEHERELAQYETIVETIDDGIYVKDDEGRFTMVNDAYVELTGYDREELLDAHASLVVDEDAIERSRSTRETAAEGDASRSTVEAAIRTADGDTVPAEGTSATLRTDDGEEREVGVVRDITERKEQRRRLEESERRYRTLVEQFPNGAVALFDETMEYSVAGGTIFDELDTTAEEIAGGTVEERHPDELAAQLEPKFRAALEGEASEFDVEFHDRHWRAYTLPVEDDDGDIFAGVVMVQDVTERIEREQALQESKNQLRALIELLPVAVFVAEADGRIVEWNQAARELWGGEIPESDSVAGYDEYDGWWADTGEPVAPDEWALARALRGEEVTDPDVVEIEGFDGERRTVLNHGMPVRNADGEVSRAVVTLIDITERREYERMLEESNERLEQFAYAASHDLQEPLRMVSSYLQLVEQRYAADLDADGREFIEYAVDGADRMRNMIEGLLQYSRVDTSGAPLEPVDLDAVLSEVREDLAVRLEESDAEVTAESLPRVEGDEEQLRQVFQNLLSNAVEYTGDDPPRIHVSAERRRARTAPERSGAAPEPGGPEWVVSVRDHGIGVDPDDADRIFDIFQSLHARGEHSGTGIGLALCERIVERHDGEIWVDSDPGEGSTFSFTVAAADGDG